jgi:hypothetical protein
MSQTIYDGGRNWSGEEHLWLFLRHAPLLPC